MTVARKADPEQTETGAVALADPTAQPDSETPPTPMAYVGKAGLFAKPLRKKRVVIPGYGPQDVRELKGAEVGEINHLAVRREGDKVITDYRGYKERVLAFALLNEDGSQMYLNPLRDYTALFELPQSVLELLYDAVDEMSALTKKRQDALGKVSPPTTGGGSSSN